MTLYNRAEFALGRKFLAVLDISTADGISMGRAIRAALGEKEAPLDLAWADAEAALPDGWSLTLDYEPFVRLVDPYSATAYDPEVDPGETGTGPTPAAALVDLTEYLAKRARS